MKKRIISMLLTVLMVMSLFSGLPLNAYAATTAGANTIEYTMGAGDYVLRICQKFGLNYYTCKDAIMILNNIYDGQWNKLAVGRTLILPASDNDAVLIANGARLTNVNSGAASTTISTGTAATYNTGTATTGTSVATTATFKSADSLAYYLVPYTMSAGENVSGVCNSLGVNFNIFSPFIKQVNGISDWTKVRAGQTLIIPTPVCPSVGTTCYGVMQHKVAGSDTAYGIASSNGVNYNASKTLLEVLNQTNNLANLTAGQWFYYPVPLTVSVPGTGNPGSTATTTTTTTVTDGNGTTTTTSTTTSKLYKLTSGMSASDGTMLFYVNSQAVTAAPAGAKVTIVTDTASGKAIQSMTVKHSDGKADLHLTGDTFVMPSCDVRVDSTIKDGHDININANYSGKAVASVNNVTVQAAVKGAAVVIKSNDPNYEISAVYAYYAKTLAASTKTALTVSSSKAFIMPDADVEVEVVLKPVATYAFYVNDPVRGSFYLQVNGNSVTRAAKGATVTVVTKSNEGYEPVELNVWKHGGSKTTDRVNVFSNTFTMPGYDVDVEVKFGAKGNNILMMPSQIGMVYAFDHDPIAITTTLDEAVTDGDTNKEIYLMAINESGTTPVPLAQLDYKIDYDIVRNSDGLKVSVTKKTNDTTTNLYSFKMPKGGVTVTPIITATTPATISGEIWMNNDTAKSTKYRDCSFSVTYKDGTKEKRTEFNGKNDGVTAQIPVLEYVDLRYQTSSGVAFVRYLVEVTGTFATDDLTAAEWSELLTNQANNSAYFQIPDGAEEICIKAYFENGKVPMGPAVISGNGSASYKVWDGTAWKSANACNPGDLVLIVVTAANGYKFDDTKYDNTSKAHSRLIVTRKDNGARIPLEPAGPGISLTPPDLPSYAYTFTMPAEGVDVQAIFDPKPFVITMKCVDETGRDLTGQGLWQIAIDWVPGVADNGTEIIPWVGFDTKFDVAYGEYVTVAMTEAGWSKYDMVSFRIDGLEYTADQLNYFYNFQMIDDRAKDLTITAVLRPKNVGIHTLSAVYDTTKLGVEFLIIDSPTGYSDEYSRNNSGALNYLNKAVTGDRIAIVANSVDSKYRVEAKDITITPFGTDADRIVPTETWIDAYGNEPPVFDPIRVFTFTMPDADVYVQINVSGTQHGLSIGVYDAKDNSPVNGMVRLFATTATGATISRDVGANNSFDDVPYKSVVQILRSELALAEGKIIKDVEIKTLSGRSINYTDMTTAGEGIYFTMPDEAVWVVIRMDDMHFNIPTVVVNTQVKHGTLYYKKSPGLDAFGNPLVPTASDPVCELKDFKPGENVYVFDEPDVGYAHLGLGDLKIYVNGMNNAVNVQKIITTPGSPEHVWSFTMPEGTIIMKAEFQKEEVKKVDLTFVLTPATTYKGDDIEIDVTVNGYKTTLKNNGTLTVYEDSPVTVASATDGFTVIRLQAASGKGIASATQYTVPDLSEEATPYTDTITVFLESSSNAITWKATGGSLLFEDTLALNTYIVAAEEGHTIRITAVADDNYKALEAVNLIVVKADGSEEVVPVNYHSPHSTIPTVNYWEFIMPAGGVLVGATFEKDDQVLTTFDPTDGKYVTLTIDGLGSTTINTPRTFPLTSGTVVKIEPAEEGCDKVEVYADSIGTKTGTSVSYTVPGTTETVSIKNLSTAKAVTLKVTTNTSYGNIGLSKADSTAVAEPASAFEAGDHIYLIPQLVYGYELDSLKVVENTSGKVYDLSSSALTTNGCYEIKDSTDNISTNGIPDGGITITASFRTKTIHLAFSAVSGMGQVKASGSSAQYTIDASLNPTVDFRYGDTVTLTPVGGYAWNTSGTPVTTSPNLNSGSSTSFKITSFDAADTVSVTLDMIN